MHNNLPTLFNQEEIRFSEIDGEFCLTAEQIGSGLGYEKPTDVQSIITRNKDEIEPYRLKGDLPFNSPGGRPAYVYTEEGIYIICMLARTPKAKEFRRRVAALLKELRQSKLEHARIEGRSEGAKAVYQLQATLARTGKTSEWLKALVRYRCIGLTQKECGKLLDCSQDTAGHYERLLKAAGLWESKVAA